MRLGIQDLQGMESVGVDEPVCSSILNDEGEELGNGELHCVTQAKHFEC
jgi:hypothetical protein